MRYAIVKNDTLIVENIVEGEPDGITAVYASRTDVRAVQLRDDLEHCGPGWSATGDERVRFIPATQERAQECFGNDSDTLDHVAGLAWDRDARARDAARAAEAQGDPVIDG